MVPYYTSEDVPVQERYLLMEPTVQITGNKKEEKKGKKKIDIEVAHETKQFR